MCHYEFLRFDIRQIIIAYLVYSLSAVGPIAINLYIIWRLKVRRATVPVCHELAMHDDDETWYRFIFYIREAAVGLISGMKYALH